MKKNLNVQNLLILALCLGLISASLILGKNVAHALNTHSIDLESGSNQYLSISHASQTGLNLTTDFTFEAWIKLESVVPTDNRAVIIHKGDWATHGESHYSFYLFDDSGTDKIGLYVSDGSSNSQHMVVNWSPATDTWYHVAVVYDLSAGTAEFFVNGSSIGNISSGPTSLNSSETEDVYIGARRLSDSPGQYFDGLIDDLRVWSVTRTETEIGDDKSRELNGNEAGLVAYWKLNNALSDSTANGNTLTNNGSATFSATAPFSGFVESLDVRKSTNESLTNSTVLQNDDNLKLSLGANKTYVIDGVIFASSTSATPDILIGFFGQTGMDIRIGYTNDVNEMVLDSGDESSRINLPANTPTSIHIKGTVTTSSTSGDLQLKWAQATSNAAATTVMEGSYLKAEEI